MKFFSRVFSCCLVILIFLPASASVAGTISFGVSLTEATLTLTVNGDSSAFYPAAFRLLADGRWERLPPVPGKLPAVELAPGMQYDVTWPDTRPVETLSPFERLRPIMVRFFDQAGVSFGEISLFQQPPRTHEPLKAAYVDGMLAITPPADNDHIRASWVLWPQEEGIAPIRSAVTFSHEPPPPARYIEWRAGMAPVRIATGVAEPSVILLHETANGYATQLVPRGAVQGREQRAAWLDASALFYRLAMLLAGAAAIVIVLRFVCVRRRRAATA